MGREGAVGGLKLEGHEESLLLVPRSTVPRSVKAILLADRGFGPRALAASCRRRGFSCLTRVGPDAAAKLQGFHGKLDYPVKKGVAEVLRDVAYRATVPSSCTLVSWPKSSELRRGGRSAPHALTTWSRGPVTSRSALRVSTTSFALSATTCQS